LAARSKVPFVRTLGELAPRLDPRRARERTPAVTPAAGASRGRVALLQGCVQRGFFGDVNAATARVLAAEGWEVHAPAAPRCCGALQYHEGDHDEARELAQQTIDALNDYDLVVTNAAGCGSAMKEYGHLIGDGRSLAFAEKVRDVTEVLAAEAPRAERRSALATRRSSPRSRTSPASCSPPGPSTLPGPSPRRIRRRARCTTRRWRTAWPRRSR